MISFDEAVRLVHEVAQPLGSERVSIANAAGRVLAAPVIARIGSPFADCSAMDGYAVREAELPGPLRIAGESFPGSGVGEALPPGCCVRVFTGAPVPPGADRVVMQEEVELDGETARFVGSGGEARYIRAAGSDFQAGEVMLDAGRLLTPGALVAAAAADQGEVAVWRRPRIMVLATGDELAPPGEASPGAIPDSVSYGLAALAEEWGGDVIAIRRLPDKLATLETAAAHALERADLIVVTGGASVGARDFAKAMFAPSGLDIVFSKVAMRPGKPVWLGRARNGLVLGLPGNPTSALVTARLLLAPLIAELTARAGALAFFDTPLAGPLPRGGDRETFVRARRTAAGAEPLPNQDSGAQRALADADLLIRCPIGGPAKAPGDTASALAF